LTAIASKVPAGLMRFSLRSVKARACGSMVFSFLLDLFVYRFRSKCFLCVVGSLFGFFSNFFSLKNPLRGFFILD
jgi:hypothetical protein